MPEKVYVVMDDHVNWKIYKLSGKAQYDEEYAGDSPLFPRVTKAFRMCIITVAKNGYRDPGS